MYLPNYNRQQNQTAALYCTFLIITAMKWHDALQSLTEYSSVAMQWLCSGSMVAELEAV